MPILYVSISVGPMFLARLSLYPDDQHSLAEQYLAPPQSVSGGRRSYEARHAVVHTLTSDGTTYLAVTSRDYSRELCFAFLEDVREHFCELQTAQPGLPAPYLWQDGMEGPLSKTAAVYNAPPDKVAVLRTQMRDVRDTLTSNINQLCERGERLQLLVDKTEDLEANSITFRTDATQVSRRLWWKNVRWWVAVAVAVAVVMYLVLAAACGWTVQHCGA